MIPRHRLPLALVALALLSLILGWLAPLRWQGLPAGAALLLLGLTVLARLNACGGWRGIREHPPRRAQTSRARQRANTPLHLLIVRPTTQGLTAWQRDRDQALGFWQSLAASGNEARLYGLDPELRLLAATTPTGPLAPSAPLALGPSGDLRVALARLCSQARPGSILVVMAPLDESAVEWLTRLDLPRRGLQLWLVGTSLRLAADPGAIRNWRSARRYAEAWQTQLRSERLAARLERRGIRWLPLGETTDLQIRLLHLWNAGERRQNAD